MTRPGTRLRALSTRLCGERMRERLIDPAIADLQAEYEDVARPNLVWRGRWVLLTGYLAWAKVMAHAAGWASARTNTAGPSRIGAL